MSRRLPSWTRTLRARLLLPLVLAGVAVIAGGGWFTRRAIERRFQAQRLEEAELPGRTLARQLEIEEDLPDVQLVVGLVLALFLATTWYLVGVEVTAPLARIAKAGAARSGGDPAAKVAVSGSTEIEALGRTLDAALGAVMASEERLQQKLVETQRLESLAVMAGGVAHDFNNLLTGVLANVFLARGKVPAGTDLSRHLDQIEEAGQRAAELSRQMLAYTGKGFRALEVLDVSRVVRDSVAILEASVTQKVRIETALASDIPCVRVDPAQIRQVLMSLVLNAAAATGDDGGTVRVRTAVRLADRALFAEAHLAPDLPAGPYVALEVSDDGHGMDAATVARIFDPLFTTGPTGRGLGLAALLGIVRSHKGAVLVRSAPGRGTAVTVLLPAAGGAEEELEEEMAPPADRPVVLIVDDEVLVRRVAANILSACGFRPVLAVDGRDALARFEQNHADVRALLLDVAMPNMDGVEVLREIRRRGCDAPALVMSGLEREAVWQRFEGLDVADFVQKPFTPSALRQKVAAAFGPSRP